jgi:hypothetical protein
MPLIEGKEKRTRRDVADGKKGPGAEGWRKRPEMKR